jgi:hypothetical protein
MTDNRVATPGPRTIHTGRLAALVVCLFLVAGTVAWYYRLLPGSPSSPRENAIMVIAPYRYQGTWVFDDASAGLVKEPFVAGVPEMIDVLVKDIPDAGEGFRLLFSAKPFPGHQKELRWLRGDSQVATITPLIIHRWKDGFVRPCSNTTRQHRRTFT